MPTWCGRKPARPPGTTKTSTDVSHDEIRQAAQVIRSGGMVGFPTETVYGLGANALDAAAVRRVFEAKGRPSTSPLIVHADSIAMAKSLVAEWPREAQELAEAYWPGPLTLVLKKSDAVPLEVTGGLQTVGVRVPDHGVALALIREAGVPLAGPSANRFTELSPTTADHVRRGFPGMMVLDGGPCEVGIESTVVSLAHGRPVLLRPGMISLGDLAPESPPAAGSHPSPGMHPRHYSPRTPVALTDQPPAGSAYLWWRRNRSGVQEVPMPSTAREYAARLYAALHEADGMGVPLIAVEPVPGSPEWTAIRDRLQRAASPSATL
ncbi:MAG: threonylcarbamoyl-AMP synthase [Bryobacteraceae bacterium]|nr:threonylcarbamoyl-AMP synthase [Bryobacteraceae bacterium]